MKKIFQLIMVLLSFAPIASISVAAHAKLSEMKGEDQPTMLKRQLRAARHRLMPKGYTTFSLEEAMRRSSIITGLQGKELEESVIKDIQLLMDQGVFEIKENILVSAVPSYHG